MTRPHVALLGLGLMGSGMARRLLGAGYPLSVYNRTSSKAMPLVADGAQLALSPRHAAQNADVMISMLADDSVSRAFWLGDDGALAGMRSGSIIVESSTVSPGWIAELSAAAQQSGVDVLDAPVTGSKSHAAAGELTFLVGGSDTALERARSVLEVMSKKIVHVGPTGSGAVLKLINNFMCGVQAASLAEALAWLERSGLNREAAVEVLANGAPGSPLVKTVSARMMAQDYTPNFRLALMRKDLAYASDEASKRGVSLASAQTALETFTRAIDAGRGLADFAAVIEPLRS